jgi:hypothetical protein
MAGYFVRVELKGDPTFEIYLSLHTLMASNGFLQTAPASSRLSPVNLPHAVYYGASTSDAVNLSIFLRNTIQSQVWSSAVVLSIEWASWGISPAD